MTSNESFRRLTRNRGTSHYAKDQWIYLGECYHCLATCYQNDSEQRTKWEHGDPSCLHELQNSGNRINRVEEEDSDD
jgi:hypothetical protein